MLKVGRTSDLPETRAKALSNHAGVLESFKLEWSKEVPNIVLAEYMLHYVLSPYSYKKEYFTIPLADAIKICNEALDRLFKPLKSITNAHSKVNPERLKYLKAKALELEPKLNALNAEKTTGISIIPLGEKNTSWEMVSNSLNYSFGKKAIELSLKEGKTGDPLRKRFVSYRSKYMDMERIDLYFTKKYLLIYVQTSQAIKNKRELKKIFGADFKNLDIADWKYGFNFKITSPAQFKILEKTLKMGHKSKVPVALM